MALYRLEKKSISRGSGHNLVAAIAYRAGIKLTDTNSINPKATTHDYSKKTDVAHSEIVLPDELAKQLAQAKITLDLGQSANLVEQGETTQRGKMKMTAKLASEYVLAGSHELSQADNIQAFHDFAKKQAEEQGVIVMVFVHDPKHGDDMSVGDNGYRINLMQQDHDKSKNSKDLRNIHAHIIVLSRQLELKNGQLTLGQKSDSELSDTDRHKKGLNRGRDWLTGVREQWADIQNESLERHDIMPVTHKSYEDLNLKLKPTKHLGKDANALERMGIKTHIGAYNESVNHRNHAHLEYSASSLIILTEQSIDNSEQWITSVPLGINRHNRWLEERILELGNNKRRVDENQLLIDPKEFVTSSEKQRADAADSIKPNHTSDGIANRTSATSNDTRQQERTDSLIAARTRARTRAARAPRPNPFDDAARKKRNSEIVERSDDLDKCTERFDLLQQRVDREARYNKWRIDQQNDIFDEAKYFFALMLATYQRSMLQNNATDENHFHRFDERQGQILGDFAKLIGADKLALTGDYRNNTEQFDSILTIELLNQHHDIVSLLKNPRAEREEFRLNEINNPKTHTEPLHDDLDRFTMTSANNTSKTSESMNKSVHVLPRRLKRS